MNIRSEKQPKIDKIDNISVRNISKTGFAQIFASPTFFNILPEIFRICLKVYFALKLGADFYLALRKNLAAKFRYLLEFGRQRLKNVGEAEI